MHRSTARRVVHAIKAPVPTHEGGTLTVEVGHIPAREWDNAEHVRSVIATYVTRYALERGCTRVVVKHPSRDPIAFDVVERIQHSARVAGMYPSMPGRVPAQLATVGFRALGAEMDRTRPMIAVPSTLPFPVLTPAGKEN